MERALFCNGFSKSLRTASHCSNVGNFPRPEPVTMAGERRRGGSGIFSLARFSITCPVPQKNMKKWTWAGAKEQMLFKGHWAWGAGLLWGVAWPWPCHQLVNCPAIHFFTLPIYKWDHHIRLNPNYYQPWEVITCFFHSTCLISSEKRLLCLWFISTLSNVTYEEIMQLHFVSHFGHFSNCFWDTVYLP